MEHLIPLFAAIPLLGFLASLLPGVRNEKMIVTSVLVTVLIHAMLFFVFSIYWISQGSVPIELEFITLFQSDDFKFDLYFYFDTVSMAYMGVSSILTILVTVFSKFYMHRDPGFKRFFNTLLLFYFGLNMIVFAGNFETVFVGWEIIGITSFLLIAFYRDRYLPVKNALKVVSLYRLSDISMLVAIWMCHFLVHDNITFLGLTESHILHAIGEQKHIYLVMISFFFLLAASVKSAQFPFSSWLPRAMEGPTSSSAIFYGSLAVHMGVFLLIRTMPFWSEVNLIKYLIVAIGLATAIIASAISNVQATVKTQIAYSSIAQIGIIFIEVALGFETIALIHFAGNAFLRTYQLLVSPSVLSYLIREQFYTFVPRTQSTQSGMLKRLKYSFYLLLIREWNLDFIQYRYLWTPFKWIGGHLDFLKKKVTAMIMFTLFAVGLVYNLVSEQGNDMIHDALSIAYAIIGAMFILKAFSARGDARIAWALLIGSQLFVALSIVLNDRVSPEHILMFLSGTIVSGLVGFICLHRLNNLEDDVALGNFHGRIYEHPKLGLVFLIASLGLAGFPFTPTFLGIDLIFSHIHPNQIILVVLTAINFIFLELSVLRIYGRIFLGPHIKSYHEKSYKSS